jgi:DNA-directed RNA polymerase II subunit RPB2
MAITADITIRDPKNTNIMKDIIENKYKGFEPQDKYWSPTDMYKIIDYGIVRLNGIPVAYCNNIPKAIHDFTQMRRNYEISKKLSIEWPINSPKELLFSTDQGRFYRPLVIVYNNIRDYKYFGLTAPASPSQFRQTHAVTKTIIKGIMEGTITYKMLFKQKIIEYITAQEQARMLVASDYGVMIEREKNPLYQYTHLELPLAIFAITTLTSPLANYSSYTKWVYQISQQKQAADVPSHNYYARNDAKTFLMFGREKPVVSTSIEKYLRIGTKTLIVAINLHQGWNQDDSTVINKSMGDCLKFNGYLFDLDSEDLDTNEKFTKPDPNITKDIRSCNYSKLDDDGFIKIGTIVTKGDIIVGKIKPVPKEEKTKNLNIKYMDLSKEYDLDFPAMICDIVRGKNDDKKEFVKICYKVMIPADEGSKLSSRHGQKGIVSRNCEARDCPFTESGLIPHLIMNPHSFPKRMTMAQFFESILGKIAVTKGTNFVADPFTILDNAGIKAEMKKLGLEYHGTEKMYDGTTGKTIESQIYIGPTAYKLTQGFSQAIMYAIDKPRIDQITGQPLGGKAAGGGLKISELNQNVLFAHGSGRVFAQKFFEDSDDYSMYVCKCGRQAIFNGETPTYTCTACRNNAQIYEVNSCKAAHVFLKNLNSIHIGTKMIL